MSHMTKDSTPSDDANGQPAALSRSEETLGSFLKRHRLSQGKELDDIAKKTRIHASTLLAIEEDNPKALPAEVFARGFIKNYAQYLGLDPNEALAWYIEQNNGEARPTEKINVQEVLAGEAMAEGRTFPGGRFLVFLSVVGVLFFAVYLVLGFLNSAAPPVNTSSQDAMHQPMIDPQPSPSAPVIGESGVEAGAVDMGAEQAQTLTPAEPEGAVPSPAVAVPATTGVEVKKPLPVSEKVDGTKPVIVPQAFKEKPGQSSELQQESKPAPVAAAPPPVSLVKAPGMNYVLEAKFTDTTWLSVQIDKEKKKSAIYQKGDHLVWQAEKKISLFVGNAGGIVLSLNGKPVPSIGKSMESARVSFPAE